jgi:uncharacterized MAPEG superfamily protein
MTTDLWYLIATGLVSALIPLIYTAGRVMIPGGARWDVGNRDKPLQVPAWASRAERAHANFTENFALFAVLVLVAHVAGKANAMTALGAAIYFWARLAHALVYTAGLVYVRTAVFFVGVAAEVLILIQLFR